MPDVVCLKDKNGNRKRLIEVGRDITDIKEIERNLAESENKYRTYFDNSPVAIFVANEKDEYIDVNSSACQLLGYTIDELLSRSIIDIEYDPDYFFLEKAHGVF